MSQIPNAISVVIPTYNRAHLIKESLQSVLDQTLQPYEIIVVDDFSIDNTEEVVRSLNSPLIKYVKNQRKKGANGARNTGILMAQGEYIAFHDSDDIWLPKKLELQYRELIKNKNIELCFCLMNRLDNNFNIIDVVPRNIKNIKNIKESLQQNNFISTQMIFTKTDVVKRVLFDENLKRLQDWDLVLRLAKIIDMTYVSEVLVMQNNSINSITGNEKIIDAYKIIFKKNPEIKNKGWTNKIYAIILKEKKYIFLDNILIFYYRSLRKLYYIFNKDV